MSTQAETPVATTTQVYRVYIKASPEAIWDAITKPEWTQRYGYRGIVEHDALEPGAKYRILAPAGMREMGMPEGDGGRRGRRGRSASESSSRPGHPLWAEDIAAETSRVTYDIEDDNAAVTRLAVTHEVERIRRSLRPAIGLTDARLYGGRRRLADDPQLCSKTLLETGESF